MYNIAIIAAGQIGSRHLQGLALSLKQHQIYVVDPNEKALSIAKQRYLEVSELSTNNVSYNQNISDLPETIDVAIIATTANVRRSVIENLLKKNSVKYLILEKIVFQKSEDFAPINTLLQKNGVKSWVNCTRRSYSFYRNLKNEIDGKKISIKVEGNNWGLAGNSIHMVDLLAFFTEKTDFEYDVSGLNKTIIHLKRDGFKALKGKFNIRTERGDVLELIDSDKCDSDTQIWISTDSVQYNINESKGIVVKHVSDAENQQNKIKIPFQSELTGNIIDQIIDTGKSDLTSYDECMKYHVPMLDSFNDHFSKVTGKTVRVCPIT